MEIRIQQIGLSQLLKTYTRDMSGLANKVEKRYNSNDYYYYLLFNQVLSSIMSRNSKQKEVILKLVKGTTSHPTADDIYEQVRREIPHISLGTVYRNLRLLQQEGKVLELDLAGNISRFDGNVQDHYHFRCEQCGHIFDVDGPVDREINDRISRKTGFTVSRHRLEFRGLCKDCLSQNSAIGRHYGESQGK